MKKLLAFWSCYHCLNLVFFVGLMFLRGRGSSEQLGFAVWGGIVINVISFFFNIIIMLVFLSITKEPNLYRRSQYLLWLLMAIITILISIFIIDPSSLSMLFKTAPISESVDIITPIVILLISVCSSFFLTIQLSNFKRKDG